MIALISLSSIVLDIIHLSINLRKYNIVQFILLYDIILLSKCGALCIVINVVWLRPYKQLSLIALY